MGFIEKISPKWAYKREAWRQANEIQKRNYDAGCMTDKIEIGLHIMKVANKPINILEELSEREAGTSNEIAI